MDSKKCNKYYHQIRCLFHFSKKKDIIAEAKLSSKSLSFKNQLEILKKLKMNIYNKIVIVCGNATSLKEDIENCFYIKKHSVTIIAADGATSILMKLGYLPTIIVTDLDGKCNYDIFYEICASKIGSIILIHAHGDNINKIKKYVSKFDNFLSTGQSQKKMKNIYHFGGFTDGDRSVILAYNFSPKIIYLLGFDFNDINVSKIKHKKLIWAKKLIFSLKKFNNNETKIINQSFKNYEQ